VEQRAEAQASPWKLGGLSVAELSRRVWAQINSDEVFDRGAALSYYFLFSLFPTLLFLTTLLGLLPIPQLMAELLNYMDEVLPGDAASLIRKTLDEIVSGARGGLLSIGAVAALWSASAGVMSMVTALNVVYDVDDNRPWWKRRLLAIGLTVALSLLIITAMVLLVFGGTLGERLGGWGQFFWNIVQWPVAVFCALFGIALVYYAAPAVRQRWRWLTPGSTFALVAWIGMSLGLRFYVSHFDNYSVTYGSIGGAMLLLLWLYLTGVALLTGAEINAEIEAAAAQRGVPDAKDKGERVPGEREAQAARRAS
jgi:membrane protein